MLRNPYFTGIAGSVKNSHLIGIKDLFAKAGANTGNFLFVTALRTVLGQTDLLYSHQADIPFDEKEHDFIAISAANWINPDVDLQRITDFIESTDLPCLVVGLGAQISLDNEIPKLKQGTERFLKVVSERSKTISVRGENTKQALKHYGIKNTTVTGCPSLLLYKEQEYETTESAPLNSQQAKRIVLQGTRHDVNPLVFKSGHVNKINLELYRYAYARKHHLLLQSELPDLYHAMKRFSNPDIIEAGKKFLEQVYEDDIGKVSMFLREYGLVYWNLETWLTELSKFDYLIGTRIHGCVSALLAGVPTVLLAHDMRTKELAEILSIKYVDVRDISKIDDNFISSLLEQPYDWQSFNKQITQYRKRFKTFFDENKILCNL